MRVDPRKIVCLVLGGGAGTRLFPLTQYRSKPAVPFAGKYRIIDIPISNCLASGINHIYVLTQFNSVSLHRHIRQTYTFDHFHGGFVEILAAQQTLDVSDWYQGTADAVRKNLRYVQQPDVEYVLILSGDQLYRMNFAELLATHLDNHADVTISGVPVDAQAAASFGIMRADESGRVKGFLEKPKTKQELSLVRTAPEWIDAHGIQSNGRECLANMGIYLFRRDVLVDLLTKTEYHDFGKEVFPMSIRTHKVQLHLFDGYWEDIGTIRSFFDANLALAQPEPPFDFMAYRSPVYTHPRFLPPTRINGAEVRRSLVADGCLLEEGAVIEDSVIGLRCRIGKNVTIRRSVLMGSDSYPSPAREAAGETIMGVGDGSHIERAIIDKNCRIGKNVRIDGQRPGLEDSALETVMVRDGIVIVPKETVLPDNWSLP